jgi:hypothetical protein
MNSSELRTSQSSNPFTVIIDVSTIHVDVVVSVLHVEVVSGIAQVKIVVSTIPLIRYADSSPVA